MRARSWAVALVAVAALFAAPTSAAVDGYDSCVTTAERDRIVPGAWRGWVEDVFRNDRPRMVYGSVWRTRTGEWGWGHLMAYPACRGGRVYVWYLDAPDAPASHYGPSRVGVRVAGKRPAVYEARPGGRRLHRWSFISRTSYPEVTW